MAERKLSTPDQHQPTGSTGLIASSDKRNDSGAVQETLAISGELSSSSSSGHDSHDVALAEGATGFAEADSVQETDRALAHQLSLISFFPSSSALEVETSGGRFSPHRDHRTSVNSIININQSGNEEPREIRRTGPALNVNAGSAQQMRRLGDSGDGSGIFPPEITSRSIPSISDIMNTISIPITKETTEKPLYSHREQLIMFLDALELPADGAGPFLPQKMYKPHTTSDRRRYVEEIMLEGPLYFISENPQQYGILLKDALHSRTKNLRDGDQVMFEGCGPSISIRLDWPGYRQWSRQIPTKDFRSPPQPITLAKLAKNVAKCVQRFMLDRKSLPMAEEADPRWRIGDGPDEIKLEDLMLVSIHHVSLGSWQPHLRLAYAEPQDTTGPESTSRSEGMNSKGVN